MAEPPSSLIRPGLLTMLPSLERLAPPPPDDLVAAEIRARTSPGDVVLDLHGRGGWIARCAVDRLRRVYGYESTALTRLLAELVLRPPDLRHLDATLASLSVQGHGQIGLRRAIDELYQSRCHGCGRAVVVDEFIWDSETEAPFRKSYRCTACRDQGSGAGQRSSATDADDVARARAIAPGGRALDSLRARFPVVSDQPDLAEQLLSLYTPRTQVALEALLHGVERDLRAAPIDAALRLALVHTLLPASRLNGYPGRVASLRIRDGRLKLPSGRHWRESNPWRLFEEGCRLVRAFSQHVSLDGGGAVQARFGDDLLALLDGSSNVVVRRASRHALADGPSMPGGADHDGRSDGRARIRLVLTQPPMPWTHENLAFGYLATSIALGPEAASSLPLERLVGPPPRNEWIRDAATLRGSLASVRPILAEDARAVLLLDRGGPGGLMSGVLGGVGAGYHLMSAALTEVGDRMTGTLEFAPPGALPLDDPRRRMPQGAERATFQLAAIERAVADVAVAVLQARGEPAPFERLLGEVLVGLDRLGHLRRLVHARPFAESQELPERSRAAPTRGLDPVAAGAEPGDPEPARDKVGLLLELVLGELSRPDHPRLVELEPGRWWLRDPADVAAAKLPLSDRLEWTVFSLLSTGSALTEATFFHRVARMYQGHDTPDEELVRACLESYRDPLVADRLTTAEELGARATEHGRIVGMLTDYAHRLGLRVHIGRREQRRLHEGGLLADLLSEPERRVYLPLVAPGDPEALEAIDCIWYLRGRMTFLWEVEPTAMLAETVIRRGKRIPTDERVVRFLVIPPERAELVRVKLARSPVLRQVMLEDNWHVIKWDHLRAMVEQDDASLDALGPILGLDPEAERQAQQMALFG